MKWLCSGPVKQTRVRAALLLYCTCRSCFLLDGLFVSIEIERQALISKICYNNINICANLSLYTHSSHSGEFPAKQAKHFVTFIIQTLSQKQSLHNGLLTRDVISSKHTLLIVLQSDT